MSPSYSDSSSPDLLCEEDSRLVPEIDEESPASSSDVCSPLSADESSIAEFMEDERNFIPSFDHSAPFRSQVLDASARAQSVRWMLKVRAFYGFRPLTVYLAVNYFDRFLCSRTLPQTNGWAFQLLSVACLSLAAKMEESLVPPLLDFQVEGAKFLFEPKTVQRMELLVLTALDWRLRSITPFSFMSFFAFKLDAGGTHTAFLISRSTNIILSNIQEASFLENWPSSIAAAAILYAASELPYFSFVTPDHAESWCEGLRKDKVINCYRLMQEHYVVGRGRWKTSKALPQLRVMSRTRVRTHDSSSPSSVSSSYKRRKLSNWPWLDDDNNGNSD